MTWLEIGDASIWIYSCILQPDVYDRDVSCTCILQKYELCKMNFHLLNIWNFLCVGAELLYNMDWTELRRPERCSTYVLCRFISFYNCRDLTCTCVHVQKYYVYNYTEEIWAMHVYCKDMSCTAALVHVYICDANYTYCVLQRRELYTPDLAELLPFLRQGLQNNFSNVQVALCNKYL